MKRILKNKYIIGSIYKSTSHATKYVVINVDYINEAVTLETLHPTLSGWKPIYSLNFVEADEYTVLVKK